MAMRVEKHPSEEPGICVRCGHADNGFQFIKLGTISRKLLPDSVRGAGARRFKGTLYLCVGCLREAFTACQEANIPGFETDHSDTEDLLREELTREKKKVSNMKKRVADLSVDLDSWDGLLPFPREKGVRYGRD